jgi:hypothetical protein
MMGFRKIKVEGLPLTLKLASEFAGLPPLPGERDVKQSRMTFLLDHLRDGTFGGPSWAIGTCLADAQVYRLDGQHSSKLLAGLPDDVPFPVNLLVTRDEWEFDTMADAPAVFDLYNHPRSIRTNEDAMGLYRVRSLQDLPKRFLTQIANGINEHQKQIENGVLHPTRARGLYWRNPVFDEFAKWCGVFQGAKNVAFFRRPAVVAEMLTDWLHDQDVAADFWRYVFNETHPDPDHDTRALAETYRSWSTQTNRKAHDYRKKAATAWKHYLRESRDVAA